MMNIYLKDEEFVEPEEDLYYLLAANGLFQIKKNLFFRSSSLFFNGTDKNKTLPWLKAHQEGINLNLPAKIPGDLIHKAISFFREVSRVHKGAEAIVLLYWLEREKSYEIVAPDQTIFVGGVHSEIGPTPEGKIRVGTIHSHGKEKAYHSKTDDKDEAYDEGIHITIGSVDFLPTFSCSVICDFIRYLVDPSKLIESVPKQSFPKEWLEKVKNGVRRIKPVYVYTNSPSKAPPPPRGLVPESVWSLNQGILPLPADEDEEGVTYL